MLIGREGRDRSEGNKARAEVFVQTLRFHGVTPPGPADVCKFLLELVIIGLLAL